MPAPESIRQLVSRFEEHREAYRLSKYNEAQLRSPQDKECVAREIESTDKAIDKLVYELYGLTEEEIKIVEA